MNRWRISGFTPQRKTRPPIMQFEFLSLRFLALCLSESCKLKNSIFFFYLKTYCAGVYGVAVKLIPKLVLISFVMSLDDDSLIYGMSVRFKSKA